MPQFCAVAERKSGHRGFVDFAMGNESQNRHARSMTRVLGVRSNDAPSLSSSQGGLSLALASALH